MKRCIAKKVFTLTSDAPDDELLIEFADALSQNNGFGGLDSLDLGDSMGFFAEFLEQAVSEGHSTGDMMLVSPEGFTVTLGYEWEGFQWS